MNGKLDYRTVWLLLLTLVALASCRGINPMAAAETSEQRAYAAYGTFVIMQEKAVDLARNETLSRSVRLGIINAEERAKPVADSLLDAINEYDAIRAQLDAGTTTEDRVVIASNNLDNWVSRLIPLTTQLIAAVQGAD